MAISCFKVLSHYIPERMRKILISFHQDGSSVDWVQPASQTCKTLVTPSHCQIQHSLWNIMYDRTGRSFHVKWCIEPISKLLKPKKRYISYAVTWPGHKHASPMSSVSKCWIWHLLVSTTNRSLPYGQQKNCKCRIFVHIVCHLYFQSTETSNEMADTIRNPRMVWSWPNVILVFSCIIVPTQCYSVFINLNFTVRRE